MAPQAASTAAERPQSPLARPGEHPARRGQFRALVAVGLVLLVSIIVRGRLQRQ